MTTTVKQQSSWIAAIFTPDVRGESSCALGASSSRNAATKIVFITLLFSCCQMASLQTYNVYLYKARKSRRKAGSGHLIHAGERLFNFF